MKLRLLAVLAGIGLIVGLLIQMSSPAQSASPPAWPVSYNFLQNAIAANTSASAPGSNDWACRPSVAHPRPVVLVHGTGGNASTNWRTYAALLKNNGYCVYALTYGLTAETASSPVAVGGLGDIVASAGQLKSFVTKVLTSTGTTKVDLIGHSQGTLMPNYYVRFLGGAAHVGRYISLASLWHGEGAFSESGSLNSLLALLGLPPVSVPGCIACGQMTQGSAFMQKMRTGTIAAPGVSYTNIVTRYDDVVLPYTSGIQTGYPNMKNVVLQDVCANDFSDHLEIASSPNAAALVLNLLDPAHARPIACKLTLPVDGGPLV